MIRLILIVPLVGLYVILNLDKWMAQFKAHQKAAMSHLWAYDHHGKLCRIKTRD